MLHSVVVAVASKLNLKVGAVENAELALVRGNAAVAAAVDGVVGDDVAAEG
jgi:fructose-specific component phosphotransferase system IIB-like protein